MKSNDFVLIMEREMHVLFLWLTVYFLFFFSVDKSAVHVCLFWLNNVLSWQSCTLVDCSPFFPPYPRTLRVATPLTLDTSHVSNRQSIAEWFSKTEQLHSGSDLSDQPALHFYIFFLLTCKKKIKAVLKACLTSCCLWQQCVKVVAKRATQDKRLTIANG